MAVLSRKWALTHRGRSDSIRGVKRFQAIAAMSLNRVIGAGNRIPWHLPEDFRWFKQMTTGQVIIMGRKTFESIGKPLPNRTTIVLTRGPSAIPGVLTVPGLDEIDVANPAVAGREIFICGGGKVYQQALPMCSDLYLTLVKRTVQGDTFFPPFEEQYDLAEEVMDHPDFKILHYRNREP
jgi:dihydrofolate reductase